MRLGNFLKKTRGRLSLNKIGGEKEMKEEVIERKATEEIRKTEATKGRKFTSVWSMFALVALYLPFVTSIFDIHLARALNFWKKSGKVALVVAVFVLGCSAVLAGNVIVKGGELNVTDKAYMGSDLLFTNASNVGIGTKTPGQRLSIEGFGTVNEDVLRVNNQGDFSSRIWLRNQGRSSYIVQSGGTPDTLATGILAQSLSIGINSAEAIQFWNGATAAVRMTIGSLGNVGIGTATPVHKLEVAGSMNVSGDLNVSGVITGDGSGITGIDAQGGGWSNNSKNTNTSLNVEVFGNLTVNNSVFFVNRDSGKIGIGTISPIVSLVINSTNNDPLHLHTNRSENYINLYENGVRTWAFGHDAGLAPDSFLIYDSAAGKTPFKIRLSSEENTLVLDGGLAGIGTGSPSSTLHINSSDVDGALRVTNTSGSAIFLVNGSNGRVGIGTSSPNARLQIDRDDSGAVNLKLNAPSTGNQDPIAQWEVEGAEKLKIYVDESDGNKTKFRVNNTIMALAIDKAGNMGIGTTAPAHKLEVAGSMNVSGDLNVSGMITGDGSGLSNLAGSMINGTDINQTRIRAGMIEAYGSFNHSLDNNTLFVDSINNRIGVGTTSPSTLFHVLGDDTSGDSEGGFWLTGANHPDFRIIDGNSGNTAAVLKDAQGAGASGGIMELWYNDVPMAQITYIGDSYLTGGDLGIGTKIPGSLLHINGTGNLLNISNSTDTFLFVNGTNGRIGIGTATPSYGLHIAGRVGPYELGIGSIADDGGLALLNASGIDKAGIRSDASGGLTFHTGRADQASERMVIDNSGNVGIGDTAPVHALDITGSILASGDINATGKFYGDGSELTGITASGDGTGGWTNTSTQTTTTLNVGIGTTSPKALLHINGSGVLLNISNSTESFLYIDESIGRVGIGTTDPNKKLHVVGDEDIAKFDGTNASVQMSPGYIPLEVSKTSNATDIATNPLVRLANNNDSNSWASIFFRTYTGYANERWYMGVRADSSNDNLRRFSIANNQEDEIFTVIRPGRVGINTTSPLSRLHINDSSIGGAFRITNGSGDVIFFVNGSSNQIGIGTSSVTVGRILDVDGVGRFNDLEIDGGGRLSTEDSSGNLTIFGGGTNRGGTIELHGGGAASNTGVLVFRTGTSGVGSERLRIDASGNVGIGTSSPSHLLEVSGSMNVSGDLNVSGVITGNGSGLTGITAEGDGTGGWTNTTTETTTALNVGVGLGGPTERLHVNGSFIIENATGSDMFIVNESNGNVGMGTSIARKDFQIWHENGELNDTVFIDAGVSGSTNPSFGTLTGLSFEIRSNDTARIIIKGGGNVGIGTTTPAHKLEVAGSMNVSGDLNVSGKFYGDGSSLTGVGGMTNGTDINQTGVYAGMIKAYGDYNHSFDNNTLFIDSTNSRVGIGTITPGGKFEVAYANETYLRYEPDTLTLRRKTASQYPYIQWMGSDNVRGAYLGWGSPGDYIGMYMENGNDFTVTGGNMGIGTFTPSSTLEVSGNLSVSGTANSSIDNSTLFVDAANDRIGIGTTSPLRDLHISDATGNAEVQFTAGSVGKSWHLGTSTGDFAITETDVATRLFVENTTGNIGIGTITPGSLFEVANTSEAIVNLSGALYVNGTSGNIGIGKISDTDRLVVENSGQNSDMRIREYLENAWGPTTFIDKARGTRDSPMNVSEDDNVGQIRFRGYNGSGFYDAVNIRAEVDGDARSGYTPGRLEFLTTPVGSVTPLQRMVIKENGNIGIGTVEPAHRLEVSGSMNVSGDLNISGDLNVTGVDSNSTFRGDVTILGTLHGGSPVKIAGGLNVTGDVNVTGVITGDGSGITGITASGDGTGGWTNTSEQTTTSLKVGINTTSPKGTLHVNGTVLVTNGSVGIGTTSPGYDLHVEKNRNSNTLIVAGNPNSGTGARAEIVAEVDGGGTFMDAYSSGYTTSGALVQDGGAVYTNTGLAGGLSVGAYHSSGIIRFYTGGAAVANERLRIGSSGNVGIGTTTPTHKLEVAGSMNVSGNLNVSGKFYGDGSELTGITATGDGTGGWTNTSQQTSTSLNVSVNSGTLYVDSTNSFVGIGDTTPGTKLEVFGSTGNLLTVQDGQQAVRIGTDTDGGYLKMDGASHFSFQTVTNGESVTINGSSGNVGIGSTHPGARLEVGNSGASNEIRLLTDADQQASISITEGVAGTGWIFRRLASEDDLNLWSYGTNSDVMTFAHDSGFVGIGVTNPSGMLHINRTDNRDSYIRIDSNNSYSWTFGVFDYANDGNNDWYLGNSVAGTSPIVVKNTDNVGIGTTSPLSTLHVNNSGSAGAFRVTNTSGSPIFFVNGSNSNVGIGTGNPRYIFEVKTGASRRIIFNEFTNNEPVIRSVDTLDNLRSLYLEGHDVRINTGDSSGSTTAVRLKVDSNGNIGINQSSPSEALDIIGNMKVVSASGTQGLYQDSSGNVGIGQTSPNSTLGVSGDVNITGTFYGDGSGLTGISASGGGSGWSISGSGHLYNDTSGVNVGIGTSSPDAKLDVNGVIRLSGSSYNLNISEKVIGADARSGFDLKSDLSLNVLLDADNNNGNDASFRILEGTKDSSNNSNELFRITALGNVGIGTTNPSEKLHVNGSGDVKIRIETNTTTSAAKLQLIGGDSDNSVIEFGNSSTDNPGRVHYNHATKAMTFATEDTERVRIDGLGNVGIGTTSPLSSIHINSSAAGGALRVTNESGDAKFFVNGSSGNVGIGTSAPAAKLQIHDNINPSIYISTDDEIGARVPSLWFVNDYDGTKVWKGIGVDLNGSMAFTTDGSSSMGGEMVISTTGNVGIGTTSPGSVLTIKESGAGSMGMNVSGLLYVNDTRVGIGTSTATQELVVSNAASIGTQFGDFGGVYSGLGFPSASGGVEKTTAGALIRGIQQGSWGADIAFYTRAAGGGTGTQKMIIENGGNVGIGSTNPDHLLTVAGTMNVTGAIRLENFDDCTALETDADGDLVCGSDEGGEGGTSGGWTNTSEHTTTLLKVGINTTSPKSTLHVNGTVLVTNGSVGIGTTTPNTELSFGAAIGSITMDTSDGSDTKQLAFSGGGDISSGRGGFIQLFGNEYATDSGLTRIGSGNPSGGGMIDFHTGGSVKMAINGSTGNVGIGTRSPTTRLDVPGDVNASFNTSLLFVDGTNDRVGIGTNVPAQKLEVYDETTSILKIAGGSTGAPARRSILELTSEDEDRAQGILISSSSSEKWFFGRQYGAADAFTIGYGSSQAEYPANSDFYMTTSGIVGIGTTSPGVKLHLNSSGSTALRIDGGANSGSGYINLRNPTSNLYFGVENSTGGNIIPGSAPFAGVLSMASAHPIQFAINNVIRMTINESTGNVGIGTTTPAHRLEVAGSMNVSGDLNISGDLNVTGVDSNSTFRGDVTILGTLHGGSPVKIAGGLNVTGDMNVTGVITGDGSGITGITASPTNGSDTNQSEVYIGKLEAYGDYNHSFDDSTLNVDSTNNRVGIGTSNPNDLFHVYGDGKYITIEHPTNTSFAGLAFDDNGSQSAFMQHIGVNFSTVPRRGDLELVSSSGDITLQSTGGNVGIGTTSPWTIAGNLPVFEISGPSPAIQFNETGVSAENTMWNLEVNEETFSGNTKSGIGGNGRWLEVRRSGATISNVTLGSSDVFINAVSGNVGIGTTTPSTQLEVFASSGDTTISINNTDASNDARLHINSHVDQNPVIRFQKGGANKWGMWVENGADNGDFMIYDYGNGGNVLVLENGTGNVGIGTADPSSLLHAEDGDVLFNGTNSRQGFFFDESTGRVGIGTTNPVELLHLNKSGGHAKLEIQSVTDNAGLVLNAPDDEAAYISFETNGTEDWQIARGINDDYLSFYDLDSDSDVLVIENGTGYVGIGTTSPSGALEVNGNVGIGGFSNFVPQKNLNIYVGNNIGDNASLAFQNANTVAGEIQSVSETGSEWGLGFRTYTTGDGNVERMRIDNDGNVGIGTTNPSTKLVVMGDTGTGGTLAIYNQTNTDRGSGIRIQIPSGSGTGDFAFDVQKANGQKLFYILGNGWIGVNDSSPDMELEVNGAFGVSNGASGDGDYFIVDDTGNVGIGTTSPDKKLVVHQGTIRSNGTSDRYTDIVTDSTGSFFDASHFMQFRVNGASSLSDAVRITEAGNVGIGTTNPTSELHVIGGANITGDVLSENSFVVSKQISPANNLSIEFPTTSSGICTTVSSTVSYTERRTFAFSAGTTDVVVDLIAGASSMGVTASGLEIQIRTDNAYCASNECSYRASCTGNNLMPAVVLDR